MAEYSIEVRNLTKAFGNFVAVRNINFNVARGEIVGFLGANGAGKSTTIRMLCGLLSPTAGTAIVAGYDVVREPERIKERIGYMSQKFSLYEDITVEENIRFYGGIYGLSGRSLSARLRWALELNRLGGKERVLTGELPVGWKQRLALSCALLHEPKIVFLDEPTGGVDPLSRRKFWELINDLAAAGVTVLVTTHYLDEAEYCHRILLIHAGELVASGGPEELKTTFVRHPILEVECEQTGEALAMLQEEDWVLASEVYGAYLHVQVADEEEGRAKISRLLKGRGLVLKRIDTIRPRLEHVFTQLIEKTERLERASG
ncbi:MAG: ABC transporter ATP-binding protein [Clostridiales bacterium]|nr:ABC transporter ATP-binding protein [Clostridiales bacterium]